MNGIKAVLFDYDGVIADTFCVAHESFTKFLHAVGEKQMSETRFRAMYDGRSLHDIIISLGFGEREADLFSEIYIETSSKTPCAAYGGIEQVLSEIHGKAGIGIVTNNFAHIIEKSLRDFNLRHYIASIVGKNDGKAKPDPEKIMICLQRLGAAPRESVFIGDTPVDIEMGKKAGVKATIGASYGFVGSKRLRGADFMAHSPADITAILRQIK